MAKFALIGEKLGHSYSQIIHNHYFELSGKKQNSYDLIEIPKDRLKEELFLISNDYQGVNVTIPYKIDVIKYLSWISPEAQKIGSVNTIVFTSDGALGYNTDYFGFKSMLEVNDIDILDKEVVILGTGGASKAALSVCEDMGAASVSFVSSSGKAVENHKTFTYNDIIKGDVLINCTPVGMYPNTEASPIENIDIVFNAVVDMIYNPYETLLMKKGRANGAKCVNGLYMLVSQAMYSQEIWNKESVDKSIVDKIYNELKNSLN